MYSFRINFILNCVVYDSKCSIPSPTRTGKKGPVMPSLKKNTVCSNTGRKAISDSGEVFSALVSVPGALDSDACCVQHISPSLEIACCTMYYLTIPWPKVPLSLSARKCVCGIFGPGMVINSIRSTEIQLASPHLVFATRFSLPRCVIYYSSRVTHRISF